MRRTIEEDFEYSITVRARFTPAVAPTPCSDPSHPRYADEGDPEELELRILHSDLPAALARTVRDALWGSEDVHEHFAAALGVEERDA